MTEFGEDEGVIAQWRAVQRIPTGRVIPHDRESLLEFIEEPFKEPVGAFYDLNIETIGSSCNAHDYYQGRAYITLAWASLSEQNRQVAESYPHIWRTTIENTDIEIAGLFIPIADTDTPADTASKALELARLFYLQPFSWAPRYDFGDANRVIRAACPMLNSLAPLDLTRAETIEVMAALGYPFDGEVFFASEEHKQKTEAVFA